MRLCVADVFASSPKDSSGGGKWGGARCRAAARKEVGCCAGRARPAGLKRAAEEGECGQQKPHQLTHRERARSSGGGRAAPSVRGSNSPPARSVFVHHTWWRLERLRRQEEELQLLRFRQVKEDKRRAGGSKDGLHTLHTQSEGAMWKWV